MLWLAVCFLVGILCRQRENVLVLAVCLATIGPFLTVTLCAHTMPSREHTMPTREVLTLTLLNQKEYLPEFLPSVRVVTVTLKLMLLIQTAQVK